MEYRRKERTYSAGTFLKDGLIFYILNIYDDSPFVPYPPVQGLSAHDLQKLRNYNSGQGVPHILSGFSNDEKTDMLFIYIREWRNTTRALQVYENLYPDRRTPHLKIFSRLEKNLREHGSFKVKSAKTQNVTVEGGVTYVHHKNTNNHDTSPREIQNEPYVSISSTRRILKRNKFKPYRCRKVHHLRSKDYRKKLRIKEP
ncbi:hypothetical protein ABEB36_011054 [Hypothenemus hampei]|uniref:Uncharacterized protein n=1 Tax=Hypothenemus hampei TaxID=57062 RepID=A0ABD1EEL5_HYPHA